MKYVFLALIIAFLGFCFSCGTSENDFTKPQLIVLENTSTAVTDSICGTLQNNVIVLVSGQNLVLALALTDDMGLSQLKVDIHDNYNCHGHSNKTDDWYLQDLIDLGGLSETITKKYTAPTNPTAGNYHLILQLIDQSGNEAEPVYYNLKVINSSDTIAPQLKILEPKAKTMQIIKGQEIDFFIIVNDNELLNNSQNAAVFLYYFDNKSQNRFLLEEWDLSNEASREFALQYKFIVPQTWSTGNSYKLIFSASDAINNKSIPKEILLNLL